MDKGDLALALATQILRRLRLNGGLSDDDISRAIGAAVGAQDDFPTDEFNARIAAVEALYDTIVEAEPPPPPKAAPKSDEA